MKTKQLLRLAVRILNVGPLVFLICYFAVLALAEAENAFSTLMSRWVSIEMATPSLLNDYEELVDGELPTRGNAMLFTRASQPEQTQAND